MTTLWSSPPYVERRGRLSLSTANQSKGVYSAETFLAYSVGAYWHGLANNAMTDEQRRLLDPASEEYRLRYNAAAPFPKLDIG
jgi:hypothetical protein